MKDDVLSHFSACQKAPSGEETDSLMKKLMTANLMVVQGCASFCSGEGWIIKSHRPACLFTVCAKNRIIIFFK